MTYLWLVSGALSETQTENNISPEAAILTIDSKASDRSATELEIIYAASFMQKIATPKTTANSATCFFSIRATSVSYYF